ncbi:NfeD family protein [Tessaracoccus antarcticus]|uniref:NfeD family protein n=1 Tax=Tessaracoccus antarcticus TaxID=2479848 RepID=A0A3M0GDT2_9ACTN|nr:NfeD family protein [Tessaracoccus antarcticus]RMB59753.1 NfeD family protein [Tessaracoccus antarcticus]
MGEDGLFGWLAAHAWAFWGVIALGLAAAELLTLDLTLLMLAAGAAAGGATALVFPGVWWLQVVVAIAVAILTLAVLRPTLLAKVRNAPGYRSSLESIVGSSGVATAQITGSVGEVKVQGQVWEARSFDPSITVAPGQDIEVYGLEGITLIVYPVEHLTRELGAD